LSVVTTGDLLMVKDKVRLLENERRLYWEMCRAALASSRGPDLKLAREDVQELANYAINGSTARLRTSVENAIRSIAEAPESNRSARRTAEVELARLARRKAGLPPYRRTIYC
jgi:hypothetical protein